MRRFLLCGLALISFVSRAMAVDFGWQTVSGGGIEYLVQVEPELIDSFRQEGFTSELPAGLRDIRRIRITVGKGQLPHQGDLTGPTIAQAAPSTVEPKSVEPKAVEPKVAEQDSPPVPPETFGENDAKPTPARMESPSNVAGAPQLLDSSRPVPPLPFFQSGPAKSIATSAVATAEAVRKSGEQDREGTIQDVGSNETAKQPLGTGKPGLRTNEGPRIAATKSSDRRTVEAGMATSPGSSDGESGAKPWGVLVAVLLGLFASLGANVYLAWIHQSVRAKYQALAARMDGGAVA